MSSVQVFLTRPTERNGSVPGRLRAAGMQVFELPALELRPLPNVDVPDPALYDVVVFVSRYAAQRFLELWMRKGKAPSTWPERTLAGTVGPSSAIALLRAGVPGGKLCIHRPTNPRRTPRRFYLYSRLEKWKCGACLSFVGLGAGNGLRRR